MSVCGQEIWLWRTEALQDVRAPETPLQREFPASMREVSGRGWYVD
jgi:hypothetical protein